MVQGPAVPTFSKKEPFPFPPGSQVHGTTVCDALLPHSRPRPILPAAKSMIRGRYASSRTSGQSRLGHREFGEDASEHTAFCTINSYSLSLHHHRYADCAIGAACTASGGVAQTAQPVLLAHAYNSTRLRDSVRQATSQVQRRSRDVVAVQNAPVLHEGIAAFLAKDAIEPIPPAEMRQGFYSPYFIVPKKGGGL